METVDEHVYCALQKKTLFFMKRALFLSFVRSFLRVYKYLSQSSSSQKSSQYVLSVSLSVTHTNTLALSRCQIKESESYALSSGAGSILQFPLCEWRALCCDSFQIPRVLQQMKVSVYKVSPLPFTVCTHLRGAGVKLQHTAADFGLQSAHWSHTCHRGGIGVETD